MAVYRVNLEKCVGCETCYKVCPMDVFRFDYEKRKSVIAFVTECQICGQCVICCPTGSLGLTYEEITHPITSYL